MDTKSKQFLCAVDGGGSGCRAVIAHPDGTIAASGSAGMANFATDPKTAVENVVLAVTDALAQLADDTPKLENCVAHAGLAGIMNDMDADALVKALPFVHCTASDDRLTSAIGGLGERDGIVIAVGTGSFAAIRHDSVFRFYGGWGAEVADQASGAWLGQALLKYCFLAWDGLEPHSDLTHHTFAHFDTLPHNISAFAKVASPADFATFAPTIITFAADGDVVGKRLMTRGAAYLNAILEHATPTDALPICMIGGLGPHYKDYLAPRYQTRLQLPVGTALDGALALAKQTAGRLGKSL